MVVKMQGIAWQQVCTYGVKKWGKSEWNCEYGWRWRGSRGARSQSYDARSPLGQIRLLEKSGRAAVRPAGYVKN